MVSAAFSGMDSGELSGADSRAGADTGVDSWAGANTGADSGEHSGVGSWLNSGADSEISLTGTDSEIASSTVYDDPHNHRT